MFNAFVNFEKSELEMNIDVLINLIIVINIILTFSANIPLAGKAFKKKLQPIRTKAKSYLQALPRTISIVTFLLIILGLFGLGKIDSRNEMINIARLISAIFFVIFSWIQIYSIKQLDEFYSPDIVIYNHHALIDKGIYRFVRHPIYSSQIFQDLFAGIALLNFPLIVLTLIVELPLYIMRTNLEEKYLEDNIEGYTEYKKRTGCWLPDLLKILKGN